VVWRPWQEIFGILEGISEEKEHLVLRISSKVTRTIRIPSKYLKENFDYTDFKKGEKISLLRTEDKCYLKFCLSNGKGG